MTAEVSVMNSLGVALAADSAVTLGGSGKVYASADKLFQLSSSEPVGVMFYGNAEFLGVPWETVVKMYRSSLGDQAFQTIEEYANDFISFVEKNKRLFPEAARTAEVLEVADRIAEAGSRLIIEELKEAKEAAGEGGLAETVVRSSVVEAAKSLEALIQTQPEIQRGGASFRSYLRKKYSGRVRSRIREALGKSPLQLQLTRVLSDCVYEYLSRSTLALPLVQPPWTGMVFAGFGSNEVFPSVADLKIEGIAGPRIRFESVAVTSVTRESTAQVGSYAQGEMVSTFMEGIDPQLGGVIHNSVVNVLSGLVERVKEKVEAHDQSVADLVASQLKGEVAALARELGREWARERTRSYVSPVLNIVSSLPKDELGEMAESLVNLTKFKRRVSEDQETVGGPIDVAVITKGDGFVWTRRKHYFAADLNPRYFDRQSKGS